MKTGKIVSIECRNINEVEIVLNILSERGAYLIYGEEYANRIDIEAKKTCSYPVFIYDRLIVEYHTGKCNEVVQVISFIDFIKELYPYYKHVLCFDSLSVFESQYDGKIYAIQQNEKEVCSVMEDDFIELLNEGIIDKYNNILKNECLKDILSKQVKIIIL